MKVTTHIISIPPYISTSWRNIHALHMNDGILVITLADGEAVYIPNLVPTEIDLIFKAHQAYLEHEELHGAHKAKEETTTNQNQAANPLNTFLQALMPPGAAGAISPIRISLGNLENLGMMLQHNPQQADAPTLPPEVLEKITSIAKMMSVEDAQALPKAEPHCNCFHCQIARAFAGEAPPVETTLHPEQTEPEIHPEDLRFQQWDVKSTGENLYTVTNKLDPQEHYSVYLGTPMGCTCGQQGCEHIVAVLHS